MRRYSDQQLATAIVSASSWRGVLRELGLNPTSAGTLRSVRRHAQVLGLDSDHFTGQRTWNRAQLTSAVKSSVSWLEVAGRLGLSPAASTTTLRGHALRLGLDTSHLATTRTSESSPLVPQRTRLPEAGALLAAAWFRLCGCDVSWPLEPSAFDLVVGLGNRHRTVQVKTTRHWAGTSWQVKLASSSRTSGTYDPDHVDDLFVIDGSGNYYLIPYSEVAGLSSINVTAYRHLQVPSSWPETTSGDQRSGVDGAESRGRDLLQVGDQRL